MHSHPIRIAATFLAVMLLLGGLFNRLLANESPVWRHDKVVYDVRLINPMSVSEQSFLWLCTEVTNRITPDKITRMKLSQHNLAGLVMLVLAAPVWWLVSREAYLSTGFGSGTGRYIAAPLILCGLTAAIHRLLRAQKNSWPLSALIAGVVALGTLLLASG